MTPLVLVHGFMGGSEQWRDQASIGQNRGLVAVDLPGFGKNACQGPLDRIEDFATWVLSELDRRGIGTFDLLGHSMGGMIVQEMIHIAPERVRNLILYGTGASGELPGRFEPIEISMKRAEDDGAKATARRISATWFLRSEDAPAYPACSEIAERAELPAILAGLDAMRAWSGVDYLPRIKARTLLLWGDKDRTYAWPQTEELWRSIPNASLAVVPDCAHAVHLEQPALFNALVETFLSGDRRSSAIAATCTFSNEP